MGNQNWCHARPYRRQHPKVVAVTYQSYARNAAPAHRRSTCGADAEAIPIVRAGGPRLSSTRFFTPSQQGLRLARQPLRQGWRKERYPLHAANRGSNAGDDFACNTSGADVLALARGLRKGTIKRVIGMNDIELGLQALPEPRLPGSR